FITAMVQSSSSTTVMLVGFVESALMRFIATIPVIIGSSIGTTITPQLIAFKLTDYSLLMIAIGFLLHLGSKKEISKNIGNSILGFGFLFFGMQIMADAMIPLRTNEVFLDWIIHIQNPVSAIIIGFVLTAIIQSSAAFIGILIILASQGFLGLEAAIAFVIGSNLGTSATAVISSLPLGRDAKRVAFTHSFIKLIGILLFVWWIPYYAEFLSKINVFFGDNAANQNIPRLIANAHSFFNIFLAIIVLPFTNKLGAFVEKIIPDKSVEKPKIRTYYLDNKLISNPALAISTAKMELLRMSNSVREVVEEVKNIFLYKQKESVNKVHELEKEIDFLQQEINRYLISISQQEVETERIEEIFKLINTAKELEQIGDIVSTNLLKRADEWLSCDLMFSKDGLEELKTYHLQVMKQISRAIDVFDEMNLETAKRMKQKFKKYALMVEEFEKSHYQRLSKDVDESVKTSKLHLELLNLLKSISNHATNIARIHLNWTKNHKES
ncbi:MAG: Na/Pi cotransporter family protein, partial [Melioribacteraceae bacterium]|nr:Na/Pi cotransporter family protein [Melioribacteraceae bacterium]